MTEDEAYKILEIPNDSSQDKIRKAYRKLAAKYHPSKDPNFNDKFKQLSLAHEKLFKENLYNEDGTIYMTNDQLFSRDISQYEDHIEEEFKKVLDPLKKIFSILKESR